MPTLYKTTLRHWFEKNRFNGSPVPSGRGSDRRKVYLFCDEFTNYNDTETGIKAIQLLQRLGYEVTIPQHLESARTWLSKGLVRKAREIINQNILLLASMVTDQI